jgi:hypothetical protein
MRAVIDPNRRSSYCRWVGCSIRSLERLASPAASRACACGGEALPDTVQLHRKRHQFIRRQLQSRPALVNCLHNRWRRFRRQLGRGPAHSHPCSFGDLEYTGLSPQEMEQRVTTGEHSISSSVSNVRNMEGQTWKGSRCQGSIFSRASISTSQSRRSYRHQLHPRYANRHTGADRRSVQASSVPVLQFASSSDTLNDQQLCGYGLYQVR